jgi:hypothetical protein
MKMPPDVKQFWKGRLTQRELQALNGLKLESAQLAWSVVQYNKQAAYPNVQDFTEWLGDSEPPSAAVCGAYLSEVPFAIQMAERLETLQAAWYPTEETKKEIEHLEKTLKAAL